MDNIDQQINEKIFESFRVMGISTDEEKNSDVKTNNQTDSFIEEEKEESVVVKKEESVLQDNEVSEEQYMNLISQSYAIASLPLIKLLKKTTNVDYTHFLFEKGNELTKTAEIEFRQVEAKEQYVLYLDIVDKDYNLNFGKYDKIEATKEALVNQCLRIISFSQFLFNHMRDKNKELLEYHLILDSNSTLYIDVNAKKRLGIRFEKRKYVEVDNN
jgi:hypothetical protein